MGDYDCVEGVDDFFECVDGLWFFDFGDYGDFDVFFGYDFVYMGYVGGVVYEG